MFDSMFPVQRNARKNAVRLMFPRFSPDAQFRSTFLDAQFRRNVRVQFVVLAFYTLHRLLRRMTNVNVKTILFRVDVVVIEREILNRVDKQEENLINLFAVVSRKRPRLLVIFGCHDRRSNAWDDRAIYDLIESEFRNFWRHRP